MTEKLTIPEQWYLTTDALFAKIIKDHKLNKLYTYTIGRKSTAKALNYTMYGAEVLEDFDFAVYITLINLFKCIPADTDIDNNTAVISVEQVLVTMLNNKDRLREHREKYSQLLADIKSSIEKLANTQIRINNEGKKYLVRADATDVYTVLGRKLDGFIISEPLFLERTAPGQDADRQIIAIKILPEMPLKATKNNITVFVCLTQKLATRQHQAKKKSKHTQTSYTIKPAEYYSCYGIEKKRKKDFDTLTQYRANQRKKTALTTNIENILMYHFKCGTVADFALNDDKTAFITTFNIINEQP